MKLLKKWAQRLRDMARVDFTTVLNPADSMDNRKRVLVLSLIFVIGVAIVSWIAGARIQSPAEAAARTAPPIPSPILVPVEMRVLTSDIVTRGTARFGLPQSISLAPSTLKPGNGVITSLPEHGAQLNEGEVLLVASGRPVFVLQGDVPVYRDLIPGNSGDDVLQLESALKRLGFDPGQMDGIYDEATSEAVGDWYAAAGFDAFLCPTQDQLAALHSLENELALATNERAAAEAARAAAPLDMQETAERKAARLTTLVEILSSEVDRARLKVGVQIPMDEIVFIPVLPVRVEQANVDIGEAATGAVLTVTNNQLLIASSLPLAEAPLVKLGLPVSIDEPDLGVKATGVVSMVATTPGTDGVDGFHIYFETLVDETTVALEGFSLRLTIPVESTGKAVIVVPVSALSLAADGTSRVQVDNDGKLEFITVEPGLSADGFVEVTPVDGELIAGQFVVIGYEPSQ
jgi:peptidoglycan hydrolase-like protein with peptidoglycan-binding domain